MAQNEPIVFLNGELIPESQAGIPIRDRGFIYGDAVFDAARTFNGVPFKLTEHVKRLFDSLRYVRIDPGIDTVEMEHWSRQVVEHNYPLLPSGQDIPRAKTHNYLNLVLGDLEAQGTDPGSWAVLLDEAGNLTEGRGSNIFLVKDGTVATPKGQYVLEGITRSTVLDLADGLGMETSECDLDLFDAYTADEAFLTSTSLCICPVSAINGTAIGDGRPPGAVTRNLMRAFSDLAGMDFEEQYLAHL
ncbi:Putative branched-chain-amino-acid aminotransferase [Geodia barretti]|uniref:Branched-chain-amino-acid aminotransferase n=1 Tax=Geodia barretti TaxID=519541 RepID=A0AA35RPV1_GEOBA|nr:Putative branched-chain-amino-acid aminotransferase [Geodia barretti]